MTDYPQKQIRNLPCVHVFINRQRYFHSAVTFFLFFLLQARMSGCVCVFFYASINCRLHKAPANHIMFARARNFPIDCSCFLHTREIFVLPYHRIIKFHKQFPLHRPEHTNTHTYTYIYAFQICICPIPAGQLNTTGAARVADCKTNNK